MESTIDRYARLTKQKKRLLLTAADGDASSGSDGAGGAMIDDHSHWQVVSDADKQVIADLVVDAAIENGGIPEDLQDAIKAMRSSAGGLVYVLNGGRTAALDWRTLLRRYVGQIVEPKPTFGRPPRRFPDLIGVLPGSQRSAARPSIVAIIDTSGSVTDAILEMIDAELAAMSRTYKVHVVECDCDIQAHYHYKAPLNHVKGRGGTDFRKPLKREFLRPLKPDLIVYFTDGEGPAPVTKPPYPLIWCLVPGGQPPADYGRVIRIAKVDGEDQ